MGVYNPWAEMPKSCVACDFRYSCPLSRQNAHGLSSFKHPNCHLVEVKAPHGRLIDKEYIESMMFENERYLAVDQSFFQNAPIIIEAEGKDDG